MTVDAVREQLWKIADRSVRGLVPRPYIAVEVTRDDDPDGSVILWQLAFSQARPMLDDRVSATELAFARADALIASSAALQCEGEEHGDCEMALTGIVEI